MAVKNYSEYEKIIKISNGIGVIAVVLVKRERKSLADIVRERNETEEIEIDSIDQLWKLKKQ